MSLIGGVKINKDIYAIIAIVVVVLVISFAFNTVHSTEATLNDIRSPRGMASLPIAKIDENNKAEESILIKNGSIWQLKKLRLK